MKILSIDFDIIMGPSIEFYNNKIGSGYGYDELVEDYPLANYMQADLNVYEQITDFLIAAGLDMPAENIHFILNHKNALNYIPEDEDVQIINIDHHHDLGYPGCTDPIHCGNWLDIACGKPRRTGVLWLNNPNSQYIPEEYEYYRDLEVKTVQEVDLVYNFLKPDVLIICGSFEWVPPNYRALFYTWMDTLSKLRNYDYVIEDI